MPREKVEVMVEFEAPADSYEGIAEELALTIEDLVLESTNVFADIVSVEEI